MTNLKPKEGKPTVKDGEWSCFFAKMTGWVFLSLVLLGCESTEESDIERNYHRLGFYNVEVLVDPFDDPLFQEQMYQGEHEAARKARYQAKLDHVAQSIRNMGPDGPELIGLAEIENESVLKDLVEHPVLKHNGYEYVWSESQFSRGLEVAFLFDPEVFRYEFHKHIPQLDTPTCREFLWVHGIVGGQPMSIIVAQWPGKKELEKIEKGSIRDVAIRLREFIDEEIFSLEPHAHVVILGDFGVDPHAPALRSALKVSERAIHMTEFDFFNATESIYDPMALGTVYTAGAWKMYDQILVSSEMYHGGGGVGIDLKSAAIHLEDEGPQLPDIAGHGDNGYPGYEDHFPISILLEVPGRNFQEGKPRIEAGIP
ncbi:endonuclease/exonuclease/phosphatase family protein [Pontibacter sp. G13]|uniref:endonuclease/exonuclease/phosphatase family protein n=1 Tax=Pontibacter sp. G13 TaxID=3074898 RepID=UPI00288BC511|nr:endonuclease/exonuclease/phosphatase family protein [Pontibacter sp. G13]WNJ17422.1 hypothetical protein RJD25_21450 [Pontibacter sp. G13]